MMVWRDWTVVRGRNEWVERVSRRVWRVPVCWREEDEVGLAGWWTVRRREVAAMKVEVG